MTTTRTGRTPAATLSRRAASSPYDSAGMSAQPLLNQSAPPTQAYGTIISLPIGLGEDTCAAGCQVLNQLLADSMTLRDLYKKHHWQVAGATFQQLHLLFDQHFQEQSDLIDAIAERIMMLGGVSIAMAADVAEMTRIGRPPRDRESVPVQISRLLQAHEIILTAAREAAEQASDAGDDGTNDLLVSNVIRTGEKQAWFLSQHVVDTPLVRAE